jgi:hypothetical protein
MMRDYWAGLPTDRFPNLTALADALFEFGLDLLLRGLAAYKQP